MGDPCANDFCWPNCQSSLSSSTSPKRFRTLAALWRMDALRNGPKEGWTVWMRIDHDRSYSCIEKSQAFGFRLICWHPTNTMESIGIRPLLPSRHRAFASPKNPTASCAAKRCVATEPSKTSGQSWADANLPWEAPERRPYS